jgi:hypothetical protein
MNGIDVVGLHTLATAIIDYRGFRIVAQVSLSHYTPSGPFGTHVPLSLPRLHDRPALCRPPPKRVCTAAHPAQLPRRVC